MARLWITALLVGAVAGCTVDVATQADYFCEVDGDCRAGWICEAAQCTQGVRDDADGDGAADGQDNCPDTPNPTQRDLDRDGLGDPCDDDRDGDGFSNADEANCSSAPDDGEVVPVDSDSDGRCDGIDPDDDNDGVDDLDEAACGTDPQDPDDRPTDIDSDGQCDALDPDDDNDMFDDAIETDCGSDPEDPEDVPVDTDGDGQCDGVDSDDDGDGIADERDNCPEQRNPGQQDRDSDGIGDHCAPCTVAEECIVDVGSVCQSPGLCGSDLLSRVLVGDCRGGTCSVADGEPVERLEGSCTADAYCVDEQQGAICATDRERCDGRDQDQDGVEDARDNCPDVPNPGQFDLDDNGVGDDCQRCELQADCAFERTRCVAECGEIRVVSRFGVCERDRCVFDGDPMREDVVCPAQEVCLTSDLGAECVEAPPACDDPDGDGASGNLDNCPDWFNPDQRDSDLDGRGDACDFDCDEAGQCPGQTLNMACAPGPRACGGSVVVSGFRGQCDNGQCVNQPQEQRCTSGEQCGDDGGVVGCRFVPDCWPDAVQDCAGEGEGQPCVIRDPLDRSVPGRCVAEICVDWQCADVTCNDLGPRRFASGPFALDQVEGVAGFFDRRTGLVWGTELFEAENLADAHLRCAAEADRQLPWRLPTIWELIAFAPRTVEERGQFQAAYSVVPPIIASRTVAGANDLMAVNLGQRTPGLTRLRRAAPMVGLCVREIDVETQAAAGRYAAAQGDGAFIDPWTDRTWNFPERIVDRETAVAECRRVGGRLPKVYELASLLVWRPGVLPGTFSSWDGRGFRAIGFPVWSGDATDDGTLWALDTDGQTIREPQLATPFCVQEAP